MLLKLRLVEYALFLYANFLTDDWSELKHFAVPFIKPMYYIRCAVTALLLLLVSPLLFPTFCWFKSLGIDESYLV